MSVIACKMYRIEVAKRDILPILVELELLNIFEPVKPLFPLQSKLYHESLQKLSNKRQKTVRAIDILISHHSNQKVLPQSVITSKIARSTQKKSQQIEETVDKIIKNAEELESVDKEIQSVAEQQARFFPLKDIKTSIFTEGNLISSTILVVETKSLPLISRSLNDADAVQVQELAKTSEAVFLAVVYQPEFSDAIIQLTNKSYCQTLTPLSYISASSPSGIYKEYSQKLKEFQAMREQLIKNLKEIAIEALPQLETWYDLLSLQQQTLELYEYVGYSPGATLKSSDIKADKRLQLDETSRNPESVLYGITDESPVHIDGWIDPDQVNLLKSRLKKLGVLVKLHELNVDDDPDARTVLRNNRLLRPFEVITNLMGTPHRDEIDPSPYVAPFFVLFFGFALGDAGYGLLMVAAALYYYQKRQTFTRQLRNVIALVLYCGLSTTFFGVVTGSWFGLDLGSIGPIGQSLAALKVFDMQSNIIMLLIASLVAGYIHQLFGLLLAMKASAKAGRLDEAIQVHGTWLLFLSAVGFGALVTFIPTLGFAQPLVRPILYFSVLAFIFGQGYGSPLWMRPFKGVLSFLNITSYLSNTLSYARLLALGLATGVIASVVNLIAVMAAGDLPFILGLIVMLIVAVIGHSFNIVLNLLGTFINVARLHLVEFFPKFFEAKGSSLSTLNNTPTYSFFDRSFSTKDLSFDQFRNDNKIIV